LTKLNDLPIPFKIDRMLISPSNHLLVTAGSDHAIHLWSLPSEKRLKTLAPTPDTVTALDMSQDGQLLVSGSQDSSIRLWNVRSGSLLRTFQTHRQAVTTVAISLDAQTMVCGSKDGTLQRWNLQTGALLQTLTIPHAEVTAVTYGGTPYRLISASSDRANADGAVYQIQVWDLRTGALYRTFTGHTDAIAGLQVVDNQTLVSFGKDRTLIWNLNREELVSVLPKESGTRMAASVHDQTIVTAHDNGSIQVWTYKDKQAASRGTSELGQNLDMVLSPNHHYLVSWSPDQRLRVWQMSSSAIH
jgi:hypothetical protein